MIVRTISRHLLLLFINLLFLGNSSALVEEQAYVRADIAWCVNSDCFVDGLWSVVDHQNASTKGATVCLVQSVRLIRFGSDEFPDWLAVIKYLLQKPLT